MLKINVLTADKRNFGVKRNLSDIEYLVIHYTGNDGDTAEANARYFQKHIVEASAHFFVDDDGVVQSVPENFVAWAVGGKKYPSCTKSGGGKWYGKCTNNNSVSVELCDTKRNGKYDFSEKTLDNAVDLCRNLMKKHCIPVENIIRHFDVVGKICPAPFVEDVRVWKRFKERLADEVVEKDKIIINGKEFQADMIRKDGFTFVKTRDLAQAGGIDVSSQGRTPVICTNVG